MIDESVRFCYTGKNLKRSSTMKHLIDIKDFSKEEIIDLINKKRNKEKTS